MIISDPTNLITGGDAGTAFAAPVLLDTTTKMITITPGSGILPAAADGVTGQALYSALKLLWKNNATYIRFPFPMEAITPEQFEFINGWAPANNITRKALRTCAWVERSSAGVIERTYGGIVSLGSLGATDQPYYQQGTTTDNPVNFSFQGPVNEAISIKIIAPCASATDIVFGTCTFTHLNHGLVTGDKVVLSTSNTAPGGMTAGNTYYVIGAAQDTFQLSSTYGGGAVTLSTNGTGTQTLTKDSTTYCKLFARTYQYTYSSATLADIGVSIMTYIVYRFPLSNASDSIKVTAQGTGGNYDKVEITWFRDSTNSYAMYRNLGAYNASSYAYVKSDVVMATNNRWYKCIVPYTSNATQPSANATNWAAYEGERSLDGGTTYYPYSVVIDADNTVAASASGVNTTTKIYERIQYQLRQNADIDTGANGTVTGKTADSLLKFVGDTLVTYAGVFIESVNSNDVNSITFTDAAGATHTYPYTAAGSLSFNANLVADGAAIYRLYYTQLQGATKKFGATAAVLVKDASTADIASTISGQATIGWSFAYDGNAQAETQWQATTTYVTGDEFKNGTQWYRVNTGYTSLGTFGSTDTTNCTALNGTSDGPSFTAVALGNSVAQYVNTTGKLLRSTGQNIGLVGSLERNFVNP